MANPIRLISACWLGAGVLFVIGLPFAQADGPPYFCCGSSTACNGCVLIGWTDPPVPGLNRYAQIGINSHSDCIQSTVSTNKCTSKTGNAAQDICVCWKTLKAIDLYSDNKCSAFLIRVDQAKAAPGCCEIGYNGKTACIDND